MTSQNRGKAHSGLAWIGSVGVMTIMAFPGCDHPAPPLPAAVVASTAVKADPVVGGAMIYLRGESPSGQAILARIGDGPELQATTLACVQCHGPDGRGRPEGGVTPSDIRWENLTRPRAIAEAGARRHPAYSEALLARAVTMGWDPAGQSLSAAMPRYKIAPADMTVLIAYIRHIEGAPVPGVTDSSIRIGIALPGDSEQTPNAAEIVRTVADYLQNVNRSGPIFQRRLELAILEDYRTNDPEVFAALSGFTPNGDPRSERLEAGQVPSVRLYPAPTRLRPNDCRESFALFSGQAGQVRSLARFTADRRIGFDSGITVLHGSGNGARSLAREVAQQIRAAGAKMVMVDPLPSNVNDIASLTRRLLDRGINTILLVGQVDRMAMNALVPMMAQRSDTITILAPAVVAPRWLEAEASSLVGRVLIASPVSSGVATSTLEVLLATKLLVEGLKEAGRDLDRESFVKAMERVTHHGSHDAIQTAFGPGRRVGVRGASILRLNRNGSPFEVVAQRIDPGLGADDWPDGPGRLEP
jgi:mono/diheme cytochrome c family protein